MTGGDPLRFITDEANRLAQAMPVSVVETLARALVMSSNVSEPPETASVVSALAHAHYRSLATTFLDGWRSQAAGVSAHAVAAALMAVAIAEKRHREGQAMELVWTGPDMGVVPFRRTEQALLQVIDCATRSLLVVSYAVYNVPRIADALIRAADRGVSIDVVIESPERTEGKRAYNTLAALGPSVASRCSVYLWPAEQRCRDETGRPGILHVKCAVSDSRLLFISSANLTEYAFTLNMELGLLITGGAMPVQVEGHFAKMIETGALLRAEM